MNQAFGPVTAILDLWRHQANFAVQLAASEMPAVIASYGGPERGFIPWPDEAPQRDPHCHLSDGAVEGWMQRRRDHRVPAVDRADLDVSPA